MPNFEQIEEFSCPICFSVFSERDNIPYTLLCGHTHCHKCLNNLIYNFTNFCGKCRKPIPVDYTNSLPINYALLGAIESIQSTTSKEEMIEFKEVERKIDETLDKLSESKTKYHLQIDDLKRKIDEIDKESRHLIEAKNNLKKTKHCLLSNSIHKSMKLMGEAMNNIQDLHVQSDTISRKLSRVEQIKYFQTFFDSPQNFYISSEKTNNVTTYFTIGKSMFVKNFPQELQLKSDCEIKVNVLKPFIKKAYIKFGYGRFSSYVEFEFYDRNGTRAKHFIERCLGEEKSFVNANVYKLDRVGMEGESFCIGIDGDNGSALNLNNGCLNMDYIQSGYVTAAVNAKRVNHFKIYLETWPSKSCYPCIGRVTKGLDRLRSAIKNKLELGVLESGVLVDLSLDEENF